jgi:hypothetical protein
MKKINLQTRSSLDSTSVKLRALPLPAFGPLPFPALLNPFLAASRTSRPMLKLLLLLSFTLKSLQSHSVFKLYLVCYGITLISLLPTASTGHCHVAALIIRCHCHHDPVIVIKGLPSLLSCAFVSAAFVIVVCHFHNFEVVVCKLKRGNLQHDKEAACTHESS